MAGEESTPARLNLHLRREHDGGGLQVASAKRQPGQEVSERDPAGGLQRLIPVDGHREASNGVFSAVDMVAALYSAVEPTCSPSHLQAQRPSTWTNDTRPDTGTSYGDFENRSPSRVWMESASTENNLRQLRRDISREDSIRKFYSLGCAPGIAANLRQEIPTPFSDCRNRPPRSGPSGRSHHAPALEGSEAPYGSIHHSR